MTTITMSEARARLFLLLDQVAARGPVRVVGSRRSAVLVSKGESDAVVETLHILTLP